MKEDSGESYGDRHCPAANWQCTLQTFYVFNAAVAAVPPFPQPGQGKRNGKNYISFF